MGSSMGATMENWGRLAHLFVTVFLSYFSELMVNPAMPDVTLAGLCPGQDECSAAIYLTGFQQAIAGIGSVIVMPLIGRLSDSYGRKSLMTIPLGLSIIPLVVLAWKRTTNFVYAYYAIKTLTATVTQNGVVCLALGYLADSIPEGRHVSAYATLSGVVCAAFVGGTLASRLLSPNLIFQAAAAVAIFAAVYMRIFLKESTKKIDALEKPILEVTGSVGSSGDLAQETHFIASIPSPGDIFHLLKSSITFTLAALVSFFNSLAEAGLLAYLLYFLKARFHFKKDQFADVLLIAYVGATISNLLFMPILGPRIGEEILLSLGLFAGFLLMFFNSIAWAPWVPNASAATGLFLFLSTPTLWSIVSKQVGPKEQGLAQGCILGITSLANVISPLLYGPLTALSLSDDPPFHFQGFSMLCVGFAWLAAFFLSLLIPILSRRKQCNKDSVLA